MDWERGDGVEDFLPKAAIQASEEDMVKKLQPDQEYVRGMNADEEQKQEVTVTDCEHHVQPRGQPGRHPSLFWSLPIPHPFRAVSS
jgi:hypothetical protein